MRIAAASHIEPLVRAFEKTEGDVLEMGTGYYSTSLLSWLCELSGRRLYSFEASRKWFEKTVKNKKPFHFVEHVHDWDGVDLNQRWGLAFIDHGPGERRHVDIKRLVNFANCIVVHDSEPQSDHVYQYSKIWDLFKYRIDYKKYRAWTTIISNSEDVRTWE